MAETYEPGDCYQRKEGPQTSSLANYEVTMSAYSQGRVRAWHERLLPECRVLLSPTLGYNQPNIEDQPWEAGFLKIVTLDVARSLMAGVNRPQAQPWLCVFTPAVTHN